MESLLKDTFWFGEEILNQMHLFIGTWFDWFMIAITRLGNEMFYILFLPVAFWIYDKSITLKVGIVFLLSATINDMFKEMYQNPRPDPANLLEGIKQLNIKYKPVDSPGFPSGHTQGSVSFWGPIAYYVRNRWVMVFSLLMIILIPYSRIYLGVHYLGDVAGGYVLGACSLLLFISAIQLLHERYVKIHSLLIYSSLLIIPLLLVYVLPGKDIYMTLGVFSGMVLGAYLAKDRIEFNPRNQILPNIIKIIAGLFGLFVLKEGVKIILPNTIVAGFFRYWLIGFWVAFAAPLIFSKFEILRGNSTQTE